MDEGNKIMPGLKAMFLDKGFNGNVR